MIPERSQFEIKMRCCGESRAVMSNEVISQNSDATSHKMLITTALQNLEYSSGHHIYVLCKSTHMHTHK